MACLVLFAFAFQAYALQTHIHAGAGHLVASSGTPAPGKGPVSNSPMECPLCQAVAHTGVFLEPAALLAPFFGAWWLLAAPKQRAARLPRTAAHIWQSRAPPQA